MSATALGAARASLSIALRYSRRRRTSAAGGGEVPLLAYRPLLTALAATYAFTLLNERVKRRYADDDGGERPIMLDINVSKALSTWTAAEVVACCRERCGAQGMFSANRIMDYRSAVQGCVTAEGDSLVVFATAAKSLLVGGGPDAAAATEPIGDVRDLDGTSAGAPGGGDGLADAPRTRHSRERLTAAST